MRLYAQGAPSWWPYHLVSLYNQRLPPARPDFYYILIDNGMFGFYTKARQRPDLDLWLSKLTRFVKEVERKLRPREIVVILPDWPYDPDFVLRAASSPGARELCRDRACYAVAHAGAGIKGFEAVAEELTSLDHVSGLCAPLKLTCSRRGRNRRVPLPACQLAIAGQVCGVARRRSLACHCLAPLLSPEHLAKLAALGATSVDSTAWTRPNASVLEKLGIIPRRRSARGGAERELYFAVALARIARAVDVEGLGACLLLP